MAKDRFKLIPAVYLLLHDGDKILLARRANTGHMDGKYGLPAGHMDGHELATDATIREAKEEIGILVKKSDLAHVHTVHRLTKNQVGQERIDLFFQTNIWEGVPTNMELHKCDDVRWFPVNGLPENIIPLVRLVIEDISDGIHYSEYEVEPE